ncbi:hypothetical protein [Amycolatopsis sp. DSM 110486]|nr:hypothetical protein [Amycolatopsis sp. DSM 110486]QYN20950.1 hypothetical protein K1T34_52420 [Amycolatopsis sp. DSM 110486]
MTGPATSVPAPAGQSVWAATSRGPASLTGWGVTVAELNRTLARIVETD